MVPWNSQIPLVKLSNGLSIPVIGYGTGTAWSKKTNDGTLDRRLVASVKSAIALGFYHLDGAEVYGTEAELGAAIRECGVAREKIFVTTKVLRGIENIQDAISTSLQNLGLDYVDLYLIHSPHFSKADDQLQSAWKAMEEVQLSGKAKAIGVSNFLKPHLEAVLEVATIPPAIDQIELHPYLPRHELVAYLRSKEIAISAFGPQTPTLRAKGGPLDDYLAILATKYSVGPGEILLRWCIDQNIVPITTSSKEERLCEYLKTLSFNLKPEEIAEISQIGEQKHYRAFWTKNFDADDRS